MAAPRPPKRPQASPRPPKPLTGQANRPGVDSVGDRGDPPGTLVLDFRRPPRTAPSDRVQVSPHGELVLGDGVSIPKRKDTR